MFFKLTKNYKNFYDFAKKSYKKLKIEEKDIYSIYPILFENQVDCVQIEKDMSF